MWGFSQEALDRMQGKKELTPEEIAEALKRREAEKLIEESGRGTCNYCQEEIFRNDVLKVWESEILVGYCPSTKDGKHKPRVKWTPDEGVTPT